jgi:hypothetical protein
MLQYKSGQFSITTGRFLFEGNGTRVSALMSTPYMADGEAVKYIYIQAAPATTAITAALVLQEPS